MSQKEVIANCPTPECNKPIFIDYSRSWCIRCTETLPDDIQEKLPELQKIKADSARARQSTTTKFTSIVSRSWRATLLLGIAGAIIGSFIGYLMRPSTPLFGQLDFMTVISRGNNLTGLNHWLLVSTAEISFNYMVVGAVAVGLIGMVIGYAISSKNKETPVTVSEKKPGDQFTPSPATLKQPLSPKSVELGYSPKQVEAAMGQPEKMIHFYKDMAITYINGKVSDIQ